MHPASPPVSAQSSAPAGLLPDHRRDHRPPAPKIDWGRLFQEGWKLIFLSPALVSLYILLFLVNGFAGIYAATYLGKITGGLQIYSKPASPRNRMSSRKGTRLRSMVRRKDPSLPRRRSSSLIMQSGLFWHSSSSPS